MIFSEDDLVAFHGQGSALEELFVEERKQSGWSQCDWAIPVVWNARTKSEMVLPTAESKYLTPFHVLPSAPMRWADEVWATPPPQTGGEDITMSVLLGFILSRNWGFVTDRGDTYLVFVLAKPTPGTDLAERIQSDVVMSVIAVGIYDDLSQAVRAERAINSGMVLDLTKTGTITSLVP